MKNKTRKLLRVFIICLIFGEFIVLMVTFYTAYFNEDKEVIVDINYYKEANIEAFLVIPLIFIGGVWLLKELFLDYFKENPGFYPRNI